MGPKENKKRQKQPSFENSKQLLPQNNSLKARSFNNQSLGSHNEL